ncbi:MAG: TlpA family protein disulfide reductase [Chloroflexi bacterium]|nr:TlpA family protein disulfide reductase [Chloroflexota bacterium]
MLKWCGLSLVVVLFGACVGCAGDAARLEPFASVRNAALTPTVLARILTATPEIVVPTATPVPSATPEPKPSPTVTVLPTATPDPATPTPAPTPATVKLSSGNSMAHDFDLILFSGETLELSNLRGQIVVLNFWASWCPSCRWEMPFFESMYQEYRDQGVVFVGVAVSDFEEDAREFVELTGVTYPIGRDLTGIARDYRVLTLPMTVFIDPEGNVTRTLKNAANEAILRLFIKGQIKASGG